ncbi:hypothetical protein, partial [Ruminococcus sp.]|uniref:hypothetical protein n=1 Tax=Ruminococcus sp. TaxID=41978 RepID=UPI003FD8DE8B
LFFFYIFICCVFYSCPLLSPPPTGAVGKVLLLSNHVVIVTCFFDGRTVFAPTVGCVIIKTYCHIFLFNFQAANEVQEVLFCAIRDFTSASPIHALRMFPHALLPRRIFDLG